MAIRSGVAGLAILAAAAFTGCGTVIDADKLEDEIKKDSESAGLVVDEVSCPEADAKKGESFDCTVTVKGEETKFQVNQEDDEGNVEYTDALNELLQKSAGG
jgi:NAD/NADP transhydrogenase alpha subunit